MSTKRACLAAAVVAAFAGSALADAERAGKTDFALVGQYVIGDEVSAREFGIDFDVEYKNTFGGGAVFGVNLTDNFNLNVSVVVGKAELDIRGGGMRATDDATYIAPDLNLDWNILDKKLTPFVTGSVGAMIFTSSDVSETDFSYGGGAGVRWDISDDVFLKVWYGVKWFDLEEADGTLMIQSANIAIGLMR